MKTLNEFIKELTAKKELQEEMSRIKNDDELAAFLKANDCEATPEEFTALVMIAIGNGGEIPDELAEAVAGGINPDELVGPVAWQSPWGILKEYPETAPGVIEALMKTGVVRSWDYWKK